MTDRPQPSTKTELDVRAVPKPERHPQILGRFDALAVGEGFVLVNDHDPIHLRQQLDRDLTGSVGWEYLRREPGDWRVRLTRLATTPLPRILADTGEVEARLGDADVAGAVWRLEPGDRDLDANLIALPAHGSIEDHAGADLDVLWHVVAGSGTLRTEGEDVSLTPGAVVYLPRRARRGVLAGSQGLRYLSVHRRKETLPLMPQRPA